MVSENTVLSDFEHMQYVAQKYKYYEMIKYYHTILTTCVIHAILCTQ
nr:MAG TPA: hypothetical protein [Caudoviricetes sp.]